MAKLRWQDRPEAGLVATEGRLRGLSVSDAVELHNEHRDHRNGLLYVAGTVARRGTRCAHDLFSFGVVLYEMATGQQAFTGTNTKAVLRAILTNQPRPPVELNPALVPDIERIIQKALAKDAANRYQSSSEMLKDLTVLRDKCRDHAEKKKRHGSLIAVAMAMVGLLIPALTYSYLRTMWSHRLTDRDTVLLADFTNNTSDGIWVRLDLRME